eukprot:752117-Hanusia_phi.AAC.1
MKLPTASLDLRLAIQQARNVSETRQDTDVLAVLVPPCLVLLVLVLLHQLVSRVLAPCPQLFLPPRTSPCASPSPPLTSLPPPSPPLTFWRRRRDYESGKAIPNNQLIAKMEKVLGCKLPRASK